MHYWIDGSFYHLWCYPYQLLLSPFHQCLQRLSLFFLQALQSSGIAPSTSSTPTESLYAWLRYSGERRQPLILRPSSGLDKTTIAGYIRLFEPLVILTLRDYTSTSSAALQVEILSLLSQLIHLRVNYCQLDADQRFLQVRRPCPGSRRVHVSLTRCSLPPSLRSCESNAVSWRNVTRKRRTDWRRRCSTS